jgi:flavin-dependent dehydrogenase
MSPDVLIAGAGPAGAVAATVLARAGARVLVLDRARFPRSKLCGDTVNPGALAVLERLGLDAAVQSGLPLDGMIVTSERVRVVGRYDGVQGRSVARRGLDAALVSLAREAGAEIEEGILVEGPVLETRHGMPQVVGLLTKREGGSSLRVDAPIVIAADGRYSRVARPLDLSRSPDRPRRWAVGAYFTGVAGLTTFGEMHVRSGYYIGVAPIPGGLANVCLVTADRAALRDPSRLLLDVVRRDLRLAERFGAAKMIAPPVCLGPLAVECSAGGAPGLLLAGDAGGFVDPMTGDGLRFAFRGGELAAHEALRALEHGVEHAHVRLLAARREAFKRKWRFNRGLRSLVGSPAAVHAAALGATMAPGLLRRIIRYAGDAHAA